MKVLVIVKRFETVRNNFNSFLIDFNEQIFHVGFGSMGFQWIAKNDV